MNQRNSTVSLLPLQNAAYPTMSEFASRLSTFSANWPSYKCRATPEDFAVAGLFYIGMRDKVKCFYCGGGLHNWYFNDSPYYEHARYFPSCSYIINKKGQRYINAVAQSDFYERLQTTRYDAARRQVRSGLDYVASPIQPNHINHSSPLELPTQSSSKPTSSPRETLRQLEQEKLCKVCHTRTNNVVLLPCSHFCCCLFCSTNIEKCPVCNRRISEKIKTYVC